MRGRDQNDHRLTAARHHRLAVDIYHRQNDISGFYSYEKRTALHDQRPGCLNRWHRRGLYNWHKRWWVVWCGTNPGAALHVILRAPPFSDTNSSTSTSAKTIGRQRGVKTEPSSPSRHLDTSPSRQHPFSTTPTTFFCPQHLQLTPPLSDVVPQDVAWPWLILSLL
ncbi:hypothetical protein EX30DRAFT_156463 [Ascodesmis nigricans]|uniref:Uncharacterized protein n=1 Tax=Ascodesmis nigricans TaxID=341454 RepID=A0A4S2MN63_9PEZI|nr:hypothetical protein EX30DRAFT_156463 [Ascodesmis nigricans]